MAKKSSKTIAPGSKRDTPPPPPSKQRSQVMNTDSVIIPEYLLIVEQGD